METNVNSLCFTTEPLVAIGNQSYYSEGKTCDTDFQNQYTEFQQLLTSIKDAHSFGYEAIPLRWGSMSGCMGVQPEV